MGRTLGPSLSLGGGAMFGQAEQSRIFALAGGVIPPYPGPTLIPPAAAPGPEMLRPTYSESDRVACLSAAFREACRLVCHQESAFMLRGKPEAHAAYRTLLTFSGCLEADEVAPAVWAVHGFRLWRAMNKSPKPPSAKWIFSQTRYENAREAFLEGPAGLVRRFLPPVEEQRRLAAEWTEMWRALRLSAPASRASVLAIVEQFFPGLEFDTRVNRAIAHTKAVQANALSRARLGEIFWCA